MIGFTQEEIERYNLHIPTEQEMEVMYEKLLASSMGHVLAGNLSENIKVQSAGGCCCNYLAPGQETSACTC